MNNPFSISFGKEPYSLINTYEQFEEIKNNFIAENPITNTMMITGVRGSGKTVLLTRIEKQFNEFKDWIVVDLNPEIDMLEYLASNIYEQCDKKFKYLKKEFNFSYKGFSISISGEKPISNVITLLEKLVEVVSKNNKKILICIDDISNNMYVKAFVQQFQIFIRKEYPLFLLMTGLYENVRSLQNEKSLTFLYRAMQININKLSLISIAESYEDKLKVTHDEAVKMAKLTSGYAFAYQVLGFILYKDKKNKVDKETINQFDTYLREYVYEKIYFDLSKNEQIVVFTIAALNNGSISKIIEETGIRRENISQYRSKLIKKGILITAGWGKLDFALPRFKEYVISQREFE